MAPTDAPTTRSECQPSRCPHVACRFHLWTERVCDRRGRVVDLRESPVFGDVTRTCVLREAARGPHSLDEVAAILGLSRERARQIEESALVRMRAADPGVLRDLLESLGSDECQDLTPTDEPDAVVDATVDDDPADPAVADESGVAEGTDDPVTDTTGALPWSEPMLLDEEHVDAFKAALRRLDRTTRKATDTAPYRCPTCGQTFPGVSIEGQTRRGCPSARCAGRAWGDRAREQGKHRQDIAPDVVARIRREYLPGEFGYKKLAHIYGVSRTAIQRIVRGATHRT